MNERLEFLSGPEKIKLFLESTHIHYTATEIYEFFSKYEIKSTKETTFTKSTIRTYLKDLAAAREIQVQEIPKKRENYYLALRSKEMDYITIELEGFWVQHFNDELLLDWQKEKLNNPNVSYSPIIHSEDLDNTEDAEVLEHLLDDKQKLEHVAFFQGNAMMNYYEIPKIVGINPFRRYEDGPAQGVQRPRQKDWIKELEFGLNAKYSAILSSSILYFPIDKIEQIEGPSKREDGLIKCKIKVPFYHHLRDNDKPGIILDGQQRMWALDLINLKRVFYEGKDPTKIFGPVSIIIGNFETEPEYETEILRMYFITSNNTKNLPPKLTQELASEIKSELKKGLPTKDQYKSYIEIMVNILDSEQISPFYNIIDHEKLRFDKNGDLKVTKDGSEIRMFSRIAVYDTLLELVKLKPFSVGPNQPDKIIKLVENHFEWAKRIMDYFNAIKCVFFDSWEDSDSLIKRNIGVYAFGLLFPIIWTYEFRPLSRDGRVRRFISLLAKWKDFDRELDFRVGSDLSLKYEGEKKELARLLTSELEKSWIQSTEEIEIGEEAKMMIEKAKAKWEEIKIDSGVVGENF